MTAPSSSGMATKGLHHSMGLYFIGWFGDARRAEQAAELAALAGAAAESSGDSGCVAAATAAQRNGAVLASCVLRGGGLSSVVIVVEAEVSLTLAPAFIPAMIRREATAGAG